MAEISAQLVKQLRDSTGAGMMECKKALQEAEGRLDQAVDILRTRGLAAAAKKAARSTRQGQIGHLLSADGKLAVLAEVNCESDFVARTGDFQQLVAGVVAQVAAAAPAGVAALLAQASPIDPSQSVAQFMAAKIAKVGENMNIARFERVVASTATSVLSVYIHPGSQLGVVVELTAGKPESLGRPETRELLHDLAMQVAAADPKFLNKDSVTPEALEHERQVQRGRALAEGKPEKMVDKIVEGRMGKYYEEFCLVDQPFIKDPGVSVTQLLATKGKEMGDALAVTRYVRFKVGEAAPAEAPAG